MTSYLLDTNHVSKVLDGDPTIRQQLVAAQQRGDTVGISTTVLGELYFAAHSSEQKERNLQRIE